jgi:hypothetical protein
VLIFKTENSSVGISRRWGFIPSLFFHPVSLTPEKSKEGRIFVPKFRWSLRPSQNLHGWKQKNGFHRNGLSIFILIEKCLKHRDFAVSQVSMLRFRHTSSLWRAESLANDIRKMIASGSCDDMTPLRGTKRCVFCLRVIALRSSAGGKWFRMSDHPESSKIERKGANHPTQDKSLTMTTVYAAVRQWQEETSIIYIFGEGKGLKT